MAGQMPRILSEAEKAASQCPVCFDVMNVPVTLHCGHSACKACLESCFASRSACPTCRAEVSREIRRSLSVNIVIRDLIAEAYPNLAVEREVERKRAAEEEAARPRAARIPEGSRTPLHNSSRDGDLDEVRRLLEAGADIGAKDKYGWTPLQRVCLRGHLEVARLLLDRGADARAVDKYGWTPLHRACWNGYLEVARLLLDRGADARAVNDLGYTPLHRACCNGYLEVARLLLDHGADATTASNVGSTPLRCAIDEYHHEVVELLRQHGAVDS
jgi:ankyrin repeat protein